MDFAVSVLRINKWDSVFERAESRKLKQLNWIPWPNKRGSNGYQALLDEFGDVDGAAIYGCWNALCCHASECHIRGILATSRGNPLKLSHIARTSGFSISLFERLVAWATKEEIGWLIPLSESEIALLFGGSDEFPTKSLSAEASGKSPEDIPTDRENTSDTQQDRTEQDKTKHNITQQDRTGGQETAGFADRWKTPTREFLDLVLEITKRFKRVPQKVWFRPGSELDREFVWQMSWVGAEFDRGVVDDVCDRLASGEINKPRSYADKVMRELCTRHGQDWKGLRGLVPPAPPPPAKAVALEEAIA